MHRGCENHRSKQAEREVNVQQMLVNAIFLSITVLDFIVAHVINRRSTEAARMLANCMDAAGLMTISYLISIQLANELIAPIANVLCFALVDVMLIYLLCFFVSLIYGKMDRGKEATIVVRIFMVLTIGDFVSLMLNPFFNHVASYYFVGADVIPHFLFEPHLFYGIHLVLCYTMIGFGFFVLLYWACHLPKMYRSPVYRLIACLLGVVAFNLVYMLFFITDTADYTMLAYSIFGYGMYLAALVNGTQNARGQTAFAVLDSSSQPTVVFDYRGYLYFANEKAKQLFPEYSNPEKAPQCPQFMALLKFDKSMRLRDDKTRFYWKPDDESAESYIVDYQVLTDADNKRTASSFVFTNNTLSIDSLTSFMTEQYFNSHVDSLSVSKHAPVIFVMCDLNQLGLINNTLGFERGDEAIALLARLMRENLPTHTVFIRFRDAKLGAICYGLKSEVVEECLGEVNYELAKEDSFTVHLKMDYSIHTLDEGETVGAASEQAFAILKTRKLLDEDSRRSSVVDSLMQMLSECDSETESHVQRTRILGDGLAFRLGLSDYEHDQLSLLCMFHDVGKVGIPLNIINKPAPLTPAEREIMREHVQKGYRIARATAGLEIIAEPILHHHENWDGSGYPDGLQHEAIPILSRIISVIDAYDAMVSDRAYHSGMPVSKACEELKRCAGTQFDPYIVDAFVNMVEGTESAEGVIEKSLQEVRERTGEAKQTTKEIAPSKTSMVSSVIYTQYIISPDFRILRIDENFEALTGYTQYDVAINGLTEYDLLFEEDIEPHKKQVETQFAKTDVAYLEHRIRRKDGTGRYVYCMGVKFVQNGQDCIKVIVTDITDSLSMRHQVGIARNRAMMSLRRLEENIQLDPLTGLLNQSAFRKACEREFLVGAQRSALFMFDMDDFKQFNDSYGHPRGDELLEQFSEALTQAVGNDGFAGRMGGDEFSCLLKFDKQAPMAELPKRVEEFWVSLNELLVESDEMPTCSAGVAYCLSGKDTDFDSLYSEADKNMYRAKDSGKKQIYVPPLQLEG